MGLIGNIIGGGLGLIQSAMESRTQKRNVDMTIEANRNMAQYAYNKDLEMWNRANEYNSPEKQMERLSSAGLNPNLVYGHGAVGNTSSALPKYNAPTQQFNYRPPVDLTNTLAMFQDFQVKQAQIDNLKEQGRNLRLKNDAQYYENALYTGQGISDLSMHGPKIKSAYYQAEMRKAQADLAVKSLSKRIDAIDLANQYKQKQVNWFVADRLSSMATKAIGAMGISKIGRNFTGNVAKGRNHDIPPIIIPSRRLKTY